MKKFIRGAIILVIIAAMVALVIKRKKEAKAAKPYGMRPVLVHVVDAKTGSLKNSHSYLAVAEPWQTAKVASRMAAKVDSVLCDEGTRVKKGQLLLKLDDSDIQASIRALGSTIDSLETNKAFWVEENARDSKLAKDGVIPLVEAQTTHNKMTDASAKLSEAVSRLNTLKTQLAYAKLTAPFDGVVTSRLVDPGDLAAPGKPLVIVEDHSALKIAFNAPQDDMAFLKKDMPVDANLNGQTIHLKITDIYPSLNKDRLIRVEIKAASNLGFTTGAFVPLQVVWQQKSNATTIPLKCVMHSPKGPAVFTVKNNRLKLMYITEGVRANGQVEAKELTPGDQVVASTFLGWANLSDGLKVEVAK